jgi:spore coat polysaccharide biosynthesis predicted glycosyltransferase SpsG
MLIIDVPYKNLDTSYFSKLREQGINIVFIDDSRFIHPDVDVLLNSSILASQRMQKINKGKHVNTRYLLGIDYFIFDEYLKKENMVRGQNETYNILVTFGGSDPTSLTMKVLKTLLEEDWPGYTFSIILGPGYPDTNKIETLIGGSRNRFTVIINPENLIPLLQHCDLAICAGGRTMYELLYLKKKFLPIATAEHEAEVIDEFVRQGIIKFGLTSWNHESFISNLKYLTVQAFDNVNENSITG